MSYVIQKICISIELNHIKHGVLVLVPAGFVVLRVKSLKTAHSFNDELGQYSTKAWKMFPLF